MKKLIAFFKDEDGLETVEWAVIAALVVVGLVGVITTLGGNVISCIHRPSSESLLHLQYLRFFFRFL